MRARLEAVASGRSPADLTVTYSDVQPLWGGVTVTLGPGGAYERVERGRGGREGAVLRGHVPPEGVRELAALLVEVEAWASAPPTRPALPDEAIATLAVRCGGEASSAWEFHRDLGRNGRVGRVRDALLALGAGLREGPATP